MPQGIDPRLQYTQIRLPTGPVRAAWVLLALNALIYLVTIILSFNLFTPASDVLQFLGWKQNDLIIQGEYWRLLTAMFLHGNLVHIFFNGYALFILGLETERIYGTTRFLGVYFLGGLAGSIASYAFSPYPSVGASGAIFGLIGGLGMFYYLARDVLGDFGKRQLQSIVTIIAINLLIGFSAGGVIDNFAHIGGLIGGGIAGWILSPRYAIEQRLLQLTIVRRFNVLSWPGAAGILLILIALVIVINPPLA